MAYTSAPVTDTYSTERIPAVYDLDIPQDATNTTSSYGMRNVVPIKTGNDVIGESRYALTSVTVASGTSRGMYVWEKTAGTIYYFVIVSDAGSSKVYSSTNGTSWTSVNTLGTDAQTPVRFTEFIDSTNTKKLVMVDGIDGYVFTSNAAGTKITDAEFPSPHIPFPIFLDGYLFLAKAGTADIYNSDLDDPAIWTAGSFISSEMFPDDIQALVKINNYLVAVGTQSCEYFYDAANPTASPLARLEGAALSFGTPFPNSIAYSKDMAMILANNNDGSISLKQIQGTNAKEIPCPFVNLLNIQLNGNISASWLRGWLYRQSDSLFYAIVFNGVDSDNTQPTLVYSFATEMWTEFTTHFTGVDTETSFPVWFTSSTISNNVSTFCSGTIGGNVFFGTMNGTATSYQDTRDSTLYIIRQTIRTPLLDFNTLNIKYMNRFGIRYFGSAPIASITWADLGSFTYNSFTGGSATLTPVTGANFTFPFVTQLGSFRQRTMKIQINSNRLRWLAFEIDINKGQQ